ncbi:MAG: hypothetical protein KJS97_02305 [Alphaproteobacteria bacterium]|nr:hypothetical protein [Alphaproteobacteria bacterium]
MSTTLTISDELAAALEAKRQQTGLPTLDAAAEALLADAIASDSADIAGLGLSDEALRTWIAVGEASGSAVAWDAATVRNEVRRRFAARD